LRRILLLALGSVALAGCRIERTPEQYIDNQAARADALIAARDELAQRIASLGPALARGPAAVDEILAPREPISVIGPERGQLIESSRELNELVASLADGHAMTSERVEVTVAPGIVYAWFTAAFGPGPDAAPESGFRISGVMFRESTTWRLIQAHVSRPARADLQ
jgi:hypothetical protein